MRLTHQNGKAQTVNVEYNQIDALLKATVEPRGDVAGPGPDGTAGPSSGRRERRQL